MRMHNRTAAKKPSNMLKQMKTAQLIRQTSRCQRHISFSVSEKEKSIKNALSEKWNGGLAFIHFLKGANFSLFVFDCCNFLREKFVFDRFNFLYHFCPAVSFYFNFLDDLNTISIFRQFLVNSHFMWFKVAKVAHPGYTFRNVACQFLRINVQNMLYLLAASFCRLFSNRNPLRLCWHSACSAQHRLLGFSLLFVHT